MKLIDVKYLMKDEIIEKESNTSILGNMPMNVLDISWSSVGFVGYYALNNYINIL